MKRFDYLILIALTLAAFALRFIGSDSSVAYIPDTQIVRESMGLGQLLAEGSSQVLEIKYPLTLPIYLLAPFSAAIGIESLNGNIQSLSSIDDYLFLNRETFHLIAVAALNLISVLLIPCSYLLARFLKSKHSGLLVAGLLAFNLLLVHFGHHARPHVPFTSIAFLAVTLLAVASERPGRRIILAATIFSAISVGTLQTGILTALPFASFWLIQAWDPKTSIYAWRRILSREAIGHSVLFFALSVVLYPHILIEYPQFIVSIVSGSGNYSLGEGVHSFSSSMFGVENYPRLFNTLFSYQPFLTLTFPLAFVYTIIALRHRWKPLALILTFFIPNLLIWGAYEGTFPRITAILVPFMALFVAFSIEDMLLRTAHRHAHWRRPIRLLVFLLVLAPAAISAIRLTTVLGNGDTRSNASSWVEAHIPADTTIVTNFSALELTPSLESLQRQVNVLPDSLGSQNQWLLEQPAERYPSPAYDIINAHLYRANNLDVPAINRGIALVFTPSAALDEQPAEILSLLENWQLINVFCPGYGMRYTYLPDDLSRVGWQDIWAIDAAGPIVLLFQTGMGDQNFPIQEKNLISEARFCSVP